MSDDPTLISQRTRQLKPKPSPTESRGHRRRVVLIVGGALIALGLIGAGAASRLEESDHFCASCHMAPERTYYNRAQFALAGVEPVADLSSAHYRAAPADLPHGGQFRCIDCHRGGGTLPHRATALALGARDAAIYFFGQPDQSIEKAGIEVPLLLTAGCIRCHTGSLLEVGFPNHFHNRLPDAYALWQAGGELTLPEADPDLYADELEAGLEPVGISLLCVDCHRAHVETPGAELTGFLDLENVVYPACEECHIEALGAPLGLAETEITP